MKMQTADLDAVAEAIRSHDRFLVTTHENPDGDAVGAHRGVSRARAPRGQDAGM